MKKSAVGVGAQQLIIRPMGTIHANAYLRDAMVRNMLIVTMS